MDDGPETRAATQAVNDTANADNAAVGRNALWGYAAWTVNLGIGLVLTPILLRGLGTNGFAAWTLALTLATYVGIVELGLGVATIRQLAAALAERDIPRASSVAASARAAYLVMACAGLLVLVALVTAPGLVVDPEGASTARLRVAVLVLGMGFVISSAASVYPAIAIGAGRADLGTVVGIVSRIVMGAAQAMVVLTTGSVVGLAIVTAVSILGGTMAVRAVARNVFGYIDVSLKNASRSRVRALLSSGWRNGVIAITAAVAIQSDVIVVGVILGTAEVAAYGIAVRAFTVLLVLATRATDVLLPTFAHSNAVQDRERTKRAFGESVFVTRAILLPGLVVLVAFGEPLLRLWLGEVPEGSLAVLVVLILGALAAAPGHSSSVLLSGIDRLNYLLVGASVAALANLGLSVALTLRFGVVGPAVGSLIVFIGWNMLLLPRYVGSILDVRWQALSAAGFRLLVTPAIAAALSALIVSQIWGRSSSAQALAGATIVSAAYVACAARYGRHDETQPISQARGCSGASQLALNGCDFVVELLISSHEDVPSEGWDKAGCMLHKTRCCRRRAAEEIKGRCQCTAVKRVYNEPRDLILDKFGRAAMSGHDDWDACSPRLKRYDSKGFDS